ncbi:hypothetical protein C8R46DRAFT_1268147 [Mycena filopes]|nr:hypothetical protein C8R46DRAFT_1268147 [Mycena filopes]
MSVRIFVILYEGFEESHLKFLDFFKATPAMDIQYASLDGQNIGKHSVQLALRDIAWDPTHARTRDEVVLLPGAADPKVDLPQDFLDALTSVVINNTLRDIITIDSSIRVLIKIRAESATQIETGRECTFAVPESSPDRSPVENVIWHHSPVVYDGTREKLQVDMVGFQWICSPFEAFGGPIAEGYEDRSRSEVAARVIRENAKIDNESFSLIIDAAAKLAAQGFLEAGTSVLTAFLAVYPNPTDGNMQAIRWPFEFLWEAEGKRPTSLPWEAPSTEQLTQPTESLSGALGEVLLNTIDTKIALGDLPTYPYSLKDAAAMCVESGDMQRARRYLDLEFKRIIIMQHPSEWYHLLEYRSLAPLILEGGMGRATGQTPEGAAADAETIIAAIQSWSTTRQPRRKAREDAARKVAGLHLEELLDRLEPSKADDDGSLRKGPAAEEDIASIEAALGMSLPQDYREFLLVSNGLNSLPTMELPGLRPVGELDWEDTTALGLNELEVTLGLRLDDEENTIVPKMGRILMLSAADDEEQVWLLEPTQVEHTLEILKSHRGLKRFSQPVGWRVVLWRHWCPEAVWFRSFRGYLEAAAKKV